MYQKIMAPLDGSELAECVLPHVEFVAKGCGAPNVIFVRVVDPVQLPVGTQSDGVNLRTDVIVGKVAESLAEYAEKNGADLIIIATHGRSGISRWAWGSVADRVLRSSCVPVLMVRAPGCIPGI